MKQISIILSTLIFTVVGCSDSSEETASGGKELYEQNCMSCHGADGDMGAGGAKPLSRSILSFDEKVSVVANGSGRMMPYKDMLSEKEIEEVVKYVETLNK